MIVISDTSAISNLFQIGLLHIMYELYGEISISPGVKRELYRVESQTIALNKLDWIKVKYPQNQELISSLLEELDLGEAESIVLAIELEADYLVIDEKLGRSIAERYGIKITGILGVLIQAKKAGLLEVVGEHINALQEIGLWLHPNLVDKVLRALGEK